MLAESHASAQLVASRAYSRRSLPGSLRPESRQEAEAPSTPTSFTWSSFRWFYLCGAALLCLPFFFQIFDFKLYGALLSGMMVAVQLCVRISFILEQAALRTRTAATAFRTLPSVALGSLTRLKSLGTAKSLSRIFLATFLLAWVALIMQKKSLLVSASFAQTESFSFPTLCLSSFCLAASHPSSASACKMRLSSATSQLGAAAASAASEEAASSFSHQEATRMQLHNEAFSLPEALIDHLMEAKLVNQEGEALPPQLTASQFKQLVPQLDKKQLRFWMVLHKQAFDAFKASGFEELPRQRCENTRNANLGNWQASSSFAKQAAFFGWIVNRHPELADQESFMMSFDVDPEGFAASASFMRLGQTVSLDYRASDTQLVWWGKLAQDQHQPSMSKLGVTVGAFAWKLPPFTTLQEKLFLTASFDWGSTSSSWQLSRHWKADSLQHAAVYQKIAESLGAASPLAKLIKKQLKEGGAWRQQQQQTASQPSASTAFSSFWKKQAEALAVSLQTMLSDVAALEESAAAGSLEEAWPAEQLSQEASEEPAGRWLRKYALGSQAFACRGLGQLQAVASQRSLAEGASTRSFAAFTLQLCSLKPEQLG